MGNTGNILIGMIAVLFGAVMIAVIIPSQTVPPIFATVAPRFYSDFTTWMLIISGGALGLSALFQPRQRIVWRNVTEPAKVALLSFVALSAAMLMMPTTHFVPTGAVVALFVALRVGEKRPVPLAMTAVVLPIGIWLFFVPLMGRTLP